MTISDASGLSQPFSAARQIRPRLKIFAFFQLHQTQTGARAPSINGSVVALRFFFTVTLDRPELARYLTFVRGATQDPGNLG